MNARISLLAAGVVIGGVVAVAVHPVIAALAALIIGMLDTYRSALHALLFAGFALALVGAVRAVWLWGDKRALVRGGDEQVHIADVRRREWREAAIRAMERRYDVLEAQAIHAPQTPALHTYAPHVVMTTHAAQARGADPNDRPAHRPGDDWRARLRPDALYLGDGAGGAAYADLRLLAGVAIAGQPRTGKTSFARLLLAQLARLDAAIIMCDPHAAHPESLAASTQALRGHIVRLATTPDDMIAALTLATKIARRRLDHPHEAREPVVVVIDEFTALVLRQALPAPTLDELTALVIEPAKVRVHVILIGHDWSARTLGAQYGAPLRRALTHRVVFRVAPDNAAFLLPAAHAREAALLGQGEALALAESVERVRTPLVSAFDLAGFARRAPRPALPQTDEAERRAARGGGRSAPPTVALPPLSVEDQIIGLLTARGDWAKGKDIAAAIPADERTVYNALTELSKGKRIRQRGKRGGYEYAAP